MNKIKLTGKAFYIGNFLSDYKEEMNGHWTLSKMQNLQNAISNLNNNILFYEFDNRYCINPSYSPKLLNKKFIKLLNHILFESPIYNAKVLFDFLIKYKYIELIEDIEIKETDVIKVTYEDNIIRYFIVLSNKIIRYDNFEGNRGKIFYINTKIYNTTTKLMNRYNELLSIKVTSIETAGC